ncbi:hypothetical protein WJX74_003589 [Apatococcus lobatus]|uniref:PDEase domain-containing protein n=1 Tax=Apatococcus lobatus TaxID=904363 RepID=A0AAW1QY55_9CHLO
MIWFNKAAQDRYGPPITHDQRVVLVEALPRAATEFRVDFMKKIIDTVIVKQEKVDAVIDPKMAFSHIFSNISPDETVVNASNTPFAIFIDGRKTTVCLAQRQSPIQTYLFSHGGNLLCANICAVNKWHLKGNKQPELATTAMKAIFTDHQKSFCLTLQSPGSKGNFKLKWTEYQMWPAMDLAENKPAMLVSTLNVTQQRELEQQVESVKDQLKTQNVYLEAAKEKLKADQAKLEAKQAALKARLQQALQLAKAPQTHVDTVTIADKAVHLLDTILEGGSPDFETTLAIRNAMVRSSDLRQPLALRDQLMHKSGLAQDVGQAMVALLQAPTHGMKEPGNSDSKPEGFDGSRKLSRDVSLKLFRYLSEDSLNVAAPADRSELAQSQDTLQEQSGYVDAALVPTVEPLLQEAANSWTFNVSDLETQSNNRSPSTLGFYLLKGSGLMSAFDLPDESVACFLRKIEDGYIDNPYHSSTHAAGVLQMMHMLMQHGLI